MALLELEKKKTVKVDGVSTDEQVAHLGTLGQDNLGSLNLQPTNYEFKPQSESSGMSYGHLKKEVSIVKICFTTLFLVAFIIGFTYLAGYLAIKFTKFDFSIFPKMDTYNLEQYNSSLRRTFLILSGMLIGTCFIVLFVYNLVIKSRFLNNYLSKINTYIYSIYAIFINCILYFGVLFIYFFEVNKISKHLKELLETGKILEKVNINTIELFKYAIVVVTVIFMVINCFNIFNIVKDRNNFIFEEEV